jgi:acetyl-CoA synthetase
VKRALESHPAVAEAAVVGVPHDVKGEAIHAFVILESDQSSSEELRNELAQQVRRLIGPIAAPERIQWAHALPKTRSGKIIRRLLKKISTGDTADLGDTSTLLNPDVVEQLMQDANALLSSS